MTRFIFQSRILIILLILLKLSVFLYRALTLIFFIKTVKTGVSRTRLTRDIRIVTRLGNVGDTTEHDVSMGVSLLSLIVDRGNSREPF